MTARKPASSATATRTRSRSPASHGLETLAFPAISTGAYGYPAEEAARVALAAIDLALESHPGIREVRLVFLRGQTQDP
jgi:O-acetyl-ADP-ribose deacetylase (regulator of RNase III)